MSSNCIQKKLVKSIITFFLVFIYAGTALSQGGAGSVSNEVSTVVPDEQQVTFPHLTLKSHRNFLGLELAQSF